MNRLRSEIGTLIFNNELHFRKCKSRNMAEIILKTKKVPRYYNIPSREKINGTILDVCYVTMKDRQTRDLWTKS